MKEQLDQHQERLTEAEKNALWIRLRQEQAKPVSLWQVGGRRWSLSFGIAVVAIALVGITSALILHYADKKPDIMIVELLPSDEIAQIPRSIGSVQLVADGTEPGGSAELVPGASGRLGGNPFVSTADGPISTFEVDTDASSYAIARRYLESDIFPPRELIRVEEFVNSFDQGYPDFTSPDFRIYGEGAPSPFGDGYELLRIGLKARVASPENNIPTDLIFVVDLPESRAGEKRMAMMKESLRSFAERLGPHDRMGIVASAGEGEVLLEPVELGQRAAIMRAIEELEIEETTSIENAVRMAYAASDRAENDSSIQAVVLCSGGRLELSETAITSILGELRDQTADGRSLSTIDFGMGDLNSILLEFLADRGSGSYFYLDSETEAHRVFDGGLLKRAHQTIATAARVEVAFDPSRIEEYRLIGFERHENPGTENRASRRIGAGQDVSALYEVKLADDAVMGEVASVRLIYNTPGLREEAAEHEIIWAVEMADMRMEFEDASPRFRLTATVCEFAEILHQSHWARGSRLTDLLPIVRGLAAELVDDPNVAEFASLVERAAELESDPPTDPNP